MMNWNVVILSKIKKLLTNITSIQSLIGTAKDSGGSTTNGTIMAKENAILTAVNKIGTANDTGGSTTAGTILGKENAILTKVNSISTATNKIGATGDTGGSTTAGTVMGKCNAILNNLATLATNLSTISTKVNSIQSSISSSSNSSAIKSIQRGTVTGSDSQTVKINSVNMAKSIILCDANAMSSESSRTISGAIAIFLSNTQIQITMRYWSGGSVSQVVSWQVVEFY